MDVTVIIPARDAEATLPAALAALAGQDFGGAYEVIVVDDVSAVPITAPDARVIRLDAPTGPAGARNRGAAEATGRILAFTDADCVPDLGWLSAGVRAAGGAALVQGKVLPPPGAVPGPFDRHITVRAEYGLYETANLFVERALFERLDGFESILVPRNGKELGEDVWLGWRARRSGARTAFAADALVHHAVTARGPAGFVAERARLRFLPELARRIPELREGFFYRRCFLSPRSARFDLALTGAAAALATRRWAPLVLALPYARTAARSRHDPTVLGAEVAADAVGAAALALGSLRSRSPLL